MNIIHGQSGSVDFLIDSDRRYTVIDEKKSRAEEIREDFGANAQQVPKYKPNRKQKRAQEAAHQRQLAAKNKRK